MKNIILLALILSLNGCGSWFVKTETVTVVKVVKVPVDNIIYVRPMGPSLLPFKWMIFGEGQGNDARDYVDNDKKALMCLSPGAYESLGINMKQIYSSNKSLYKLIEKYEADRKPKEEVK